MCDAYIVDCVRTAGGRKKGRLSQWHPADLGAVVVDALVERTGIPPAEIDDVIWGCVSQVGAQAGNLGRNVVLASSLPESVPGTTVDRQCGSSQQAIHFAAQAVMSGTQDAVIAGGTEVMSMVPIGANIIDGVRAGHGNVMSKNIKKRYPKVTMWSQFGGAEMVAKKYGITREDMDNFGYTSQLNAAKATKEGRFRNEIIPIPGIDRKTKETVTHDSDEGIRPNVSLEKMAKLRTLAKNGRITAATSSQICDGSAAVLICNKAGLKRLGLKPRAQFVSLAVVGADPILMLEGPIPATIKALKVANLTIDDIDLYEVNEAFASVPLAWAKTLKADMKKLNVNGGAMALGHPLGGTGAKLMTTLVNELERTGGTYGVEAICEGGGTGNACIIKRIASSKL